MKKLTALLLLLPMLASFAEDTESPSAYLCIADMATGFKYENGTWQRTNFNVDDSKYILRHSTETDNSWVKEHKWAWVEFGEKTAFTWCDKAEDSDFFKCSGIGGDVSMNQKTLRYQLYFRGAYLSQMEEQYKDTPHIEIGKCTPL